MPTPLPQSKQSPLQLSLLLKAVTALLVSLASGLTCALLALLYILRHGATLAYQSLNSLIKTRLIGINLKLTGLFLLPAAILLAASLLVLGLMFYGLFMGFEQGYQQVSLKACRTVTAELHSRIQHDLSQIRLALIRFANQAPPHDQGPFDLALISLGKALIGGLMGGLIFLLFATGYGLLFSIPALFWWCAVCLRSAALPWILKPLALLLMPIGAAILALIAPLAGLAYGFLNCARHSYQKGLGVTLRESFASLPGLHKIAMRYLFI